MDVIDNLKYLIDRGHDEFTNSEIIISGNGLFFDEESFQFISNLNFHNCVFKGLYLEFEDINLPNFKLGFFDCKFELSLKISDCNFERLGFRDIKSSKSITISGDYRDFFFRNNGFEEKRENILACNISLSNMIVSQKFELDYLNHIEGEFNFHNNEITVIKSNEIIKFNNSTFNNVKFIDSKFLSETSFKEIEIRRECKFEECEFDKVNFSNLIIGKLNFIGCKFFKTSVFHYIDGNISSNIDFESCLFEKYIQFNGTNSSSFGMDNVEFKKNVSFQETKFNEFSIDRTIFEKGALFDEIQIKNIHNCDRRTIRILKRELANSQNQIDYLRFKAYELNAYKKEIDKNKLSWKDSLILYFNESSNNFGLDWTKGISFIFQWSFAFYMLYLITFAIVNKTNKNFPQSIEEFSVLYLKFINPLSFLKSPIEDAENYFFPLLFLLLGKIFVSYGIYQTIQAFRKFGVNGG